jgi:lipid-A-disaccharide synthase
MEIAGQHRRIRAEDVAVMGVTEILRHIPGIYLSYRRLVRSIQRDRPDIAILIDFPDVNFRLAKHLHRAGVPVIWFVSPQLWAWKRRRLRWVQERVDKMLVIFPFEETFYRERGVDAEFVGHPLAATTAPIPTREDYAARYNLDPAKTWIAVLPGSRWKEVRANLPELHALAMGDLITGAAAYTTFDGRTTRQPRDPAAHTLYEFLLPVASTIDPKALQRYIATLNAEHLKYFGPEASTLRLTLVDDAREALTHARASALTFALAKKLVEYPEEFPLKLDLDGNLPVAMANLIAGRRIVPELLQSRFTAENVAAALSPLLADGPERDQQMADLAQVRAALDPAANPIQRVAAAVLSLLP